MKSNDYHRRSQCPLLSAAPPESPASSRKLQVFSTQPGRLLRKGTDSSVPTAPSPQEVPGPLPWEEGVGGTTPGEESFVAPGFSPAFAPSASSGARFPLAELAAQTVPLCGICGLCSDLGSGTLRITPPFLAAGNEVCKLFTFHNPAIPLTGLDSYKPQELSN